MGTLLADLLLDLAKVLHWLGKSLECNAVTLLSRYVRLRGLDDLEKLEAHVVEAERLAHLKEWYDKPGGEWALCCPMPECQLPMVVPYTALADGEEQDQPTAGVPNHRGKEGQRSCMGVGRRTVAVWMVHR